MAKIRLSRVESSAFKNSSYAGLSVVGPHVHMHARCDWAAVQIKEKYQNGCYLQTTHQND